MVPKGLNNAIIEPYLYKKMTENIVHSKIRVRFAPSPTGYLHVGSLRTALYNYLFAKKQGGTYLLRIEDTDQSRLVIGAKESLVRSLDTMGVNASEGVVLKEGSVAEIGEYGPYEQSKRLPIYREYVEKLLDSGHAYYCFCTADRLDAVRKEMIANKLPPRYDKHCVNLPKEEVTALLQKNTPHVIRLNVTPGEDISFVDLVRGPVTINSKEVDDQVLLKTDGFPTYHLAVVVDDHLMGITHILRSEEWLPSTPKHILLFRAFGWEIPEIGHVSFILGPGGKKKLSKRDGGASVEEYLKDGYLPEALLNFLALLGWNPGSGSTQEIFSLEELEETFDLKGLHKAGAAFDRKKLDWMNGEYIKKLSLDKLFQRLVEGEFFDRDFIKSAPEVMQAESYLYKVLTVEQERLVTLGEFGKENPFLFVDELSYDPKLLAWKENTVSETKSALEKAVEVLENAPASLWESREALQGYLLEAAGEKRGDFLWPLRVALTGAQKSPSPADVAWVLGKEITLERLRKAISTL